jgi:hypothetical protein
VEDNGIGFGEFARRSFGRLAWQLATLNADQQIVQQAG